MTSSKQRILVVANRTADSPELIAALRRQSERAPSSFTLLVPAVPHGLAWAADMKAGWSEAVGRAERPGHPGECPGAAPATAGTRARACRRRLSSVVVPAALLASAFGRA